MKKRLTSFILVLALSFSLFSVSASADFSYSDSRTLTDIYKVLQSLYLSPDSWQRNSVIGFLDRILSVLPSNLATNFRLVAGDGTNAILDDVRDWTKLSYDTLTSDNIAGKLRDIQLNTFDTVDRINSSNTLLDKIYYAVARMDGFATENTLSSFFSHFDYLFSPVSGTSSSLQSGFFIPEYQDRTTLSYMSYSWFLGALYSNFIYDGFLPYHSADDDYTLYHFIKNLSLTLASEDDRQLGDNYKENRDQAQKDFLGGQSGPTSLGKGDFSDASQVGGALNDTFNMGGAAKVSDFLSGFGSAGTESQAWFSQTTANNLNSVEADDTSGVSTFADDGVTMVDVDSDPYNMASIFERYDWLEGVSIDG